MHCLKQNILSKIIMQSLSKKSLSLLSFICLILVSLSLSSCTQQILRKRAQESRTVVLDIGHYYANGRGEGARTPDGHHGGPLDENTFWNLYAGETKKVIEKAGYRCIITNRGAIPNNPHLARSSRAANVVQLNAPNPKAIYRSEQHPKYRAVGMGPVNYALNQEPACVIFLHHNSSAAQWEEYYNAQVYCNKEGVALSRSIARYFNEHILNKSVSNGGNQCGIIIRENGRLGGGDWLNACNASYVPAAITEMTFMNNPKHARYLNNKKNAKLYAQALGHSIVEYLISR